MPISAAIPRSIDDNHAGWLGRITCSGMWNAHAKQSALE
jgi:hypothetical protein